MLRSRDFQLPKNTYYYITSYIEGPTQQIMGTGLFEILYQLKVQSSASEVGCLDPYADLVAQGKDLAG